MNTSELDPAVVAPPSKVSSWLGRIWTLVAFVWKFFVGVAFCQSLIGSLFIVGWTYRLLQRNALKFWWKASPQQPLYSNFTAWAKHTPGATTHRSWPNWFVWQNALDEFRQARAAGGARSYLRLVALPFHSLWLNFRVGVLGAFNTAVLTLPGATLWLFSWYDGWNNSFNKGYEQAIVGPLLGIAGIILFVAAMLYVPLAQARQAVTGEWKAFYQFPLIWTLVRRHWLAGIFLAGLYSLCALPLQILKTGLMFAANGNPAIENFTDAQALAYLNHYFFRAAIVIFPLYVLTKLVATRIYARAILQALQCGHLAVQQLSVVERHYLQTLDLVQVDPPRSRHVLTRVAVGTTAGVFRFAGLGLAAFLWFTFVAQIYIAEFLKYNPILGWLNQPLVQLPWFRYIPVRLQNQGSEIAGVALLLALVGLCLWITRKLRPAVRPETRSIQEGC